MSEERFRWDVLFRTAEQRLKMRRREILDYTLSQLLNALDTRDPDDPFTGTIPINSLDDIQDLIG